MSDYPPDGWTMTAGTWNTDAAVSTARTYIGASTILFPDGASSSVRLTSDYVEVQQHQPYTISCWLNQDGVFTHPYVAIDWYTKSKVYSSSTSVLDGALDNSDVWQQVQKTYTCPLTGDGGFARITVGKNGAGADSDAVWFAGADLLPAKVAFRGYLTADQTIHTGEITVVGITDHGGGWTTQYDYGNCFNVLSNERFTVYAAEPQSHGDFIQRVHFDGAVRYLSLADGVHAYMGFSLSGSIWIVSEIYMGAAGSPTLHGSIDLELTGDDYVQLITYHDAGGDEAIDAVYTTFSGHVIG